jgi:hypothetical protein
MLWLLVHIPALLCAKLLSLSYAQTPQAVLLQDKQHEAATSYVLHLALTLIPMAGSPNWMERAKGTILCN